MRVAVDATALVSRPTGVGVVTRELLRGLGTRSAIVPSAFALTWRGRDQLAGSLPPGVRAIRRPMAARPLREAWNRSDLPPIEAWTGAVDVVHGPNFVVPPSRRAARVVTIHDLTFLHYPELCTADTLGYPPLIRRALADGAWVHAVSPFVAAEVIEAFGAAPDRVVAVSNGAPPAPDRPADAEHGRRLAGHDRFVLAVGTVEPRKDLPSLVDAFASLPGDDLRLVIAGQDGWGAEALTVAIDRQPAAVRSRIARLGWVADEDRNDLLAAAAAVAYPSRYEGFGFIPLEAMAAGAPVVTTSAGALPETVGDAAIVVPPRDSEALAEALQRVLDDAELADQLRRRGHERVRAYSWEDTVDGVVGLYRRAVLDRRPRP